MPFTYKKDEDALTLIIPFERTLEKSRLLLQERGQHFLWAYLVSEALAQVGDHGASRRDLVGEKVEAAKRYWKEQTSEELRRETALFRTLAIEREDFWAFTLSVYTEGKGDRKAVAFRMNGFLNTVEIKGTGVHMPSLLGDVTSVDRARSLAIDLVRQAILGLAKFLPSSAELGIP